MPLMKPRPIGLTPQENLQGTPPIVQQNTERYRRIIGDPRVTDPTVQRKGEPSVVYNRRQNNQSRFAMQQLAGVTPVQPQVPQQAADKLIQAAAMGATQPFQVGAQPIESAADFQASSDPTSTLNAQRVPLRQKGAEGSAAEQFMSGQLRAWKKSFSQALAGDARPELTEDDFYALAQSVEGYHPAIKSDVAQYLELNLPENLKKQRAENTAIERRREMVATEANRGNALSLRAAFPDQQEIADMYEQGIQPDQATLDELQARGYTFMDAAGRPLPVNPDMARERDFTRELDETQRRGELNVKLKKQQDELEAKAQNAETIRVAEARGASVAETGRLLGGVPLLGEAKEPKPDEQQLRHKKSVEEYRSLETEAQRMQRRAEKLTAGKGNDRRLSVFADTGGKPVLASPDDLQKIEEDNLIPWDVYQGGRQAELVGAAGLAADDAVKETASLGLTPEAATQVKQAYSQFYQSLFSQESDDMLYEQADQIAKLMGVPPAPKQAFKAALPSFRESLLNRAMK